MGRGGLVKAKGGVAMEAVGGAWVALGGELRIQTVEEERAPHPMPVSISSQEWWWGVVDLGGCRRRSGHRQEAVDAGVAVTPGGGRKVLTLLGHTRAFFLRFLSSSVSSLAS